MNLSDIQIQELYVRGKNYARVLAVLWDDQDEVVGRAWVKLMEVLINYPIEKHEEVAYNFWKTAVKQSAVDNYRQSRRLKFPYSVEVEEDIALVYEEDEREVRILHAIYEYLDDRDITTLLALVDNNLSIAKAAQYLGQQRTNLYHIVKRIREKIKNVVPEMFEEKPLKGFSQVYTPKSSEWNRFFSTVEACTYREWGAELFDKTEEERLEGKTVAPRNRTVKGLWPTSSPSIQSLSLEEWENDN